MALPTAAIRCPLVAVPALSLFVLPHVRKVPFDVFKDFVPVSSFTNAALLIGVHPSVPANSVQELVTSAKANPGKVGWDTAGIGSQC